MIRALIVARSAIVAAGLESWLRSSPEVEVVGKLPDFLALSAALEELHPDVVLVDPQDLEALLRKPDAPPASAEALTPREIEVLRMLAEGLGNKTIAWRLGISEHTVKFHVASIMGKLNAGSRTEAVTQGIRRGVILL